MDIVQKPHQNHLFLVDAQVATCTGFGVFWKVLFRWKGSIYKVSPGTLGLGILYCIICKKKAGYRAHNTAGASADGYKKINNYFFLFL
jgi:hypothetical protein